MVVAASSAAANSSSFSWTMNNRFVDGEKNKMFHPLDDGPLTLSGDIWATGKKSRATSDPESITIRVLKRGVFNSEACTVSVTPDKTLNKKKSFSKSCGHVE